MRKKGTPNNFWTKERCAIEAKKYKTRKEFCKNSNTAYQKSLKNKWLDEICLHMADIFTKTNKLTKNDCLKIALNYKYKKDFKRESPNVYDKAFRNNWINDICLHMKLIGNKYYRLIYSFEFPDNSVYVGLTYNSEERYKEHLINESDRIYSSVFKHMQLTNLQPEFKLLTDYVDYKEAINLEGEYLEKYKQDGWNILNKRKTGGLGNVGVYWSKEKCFEEALKYNSRVEFFNKNSSAYFVTLKNGWIDELCSHMVVLKHSPGYWNNYENCKKESLKYKNREEFRKNARTAYKFTIKNKWIDDFYDKNYVKYSVKQINILNNEIIKIFPSAKKAAEELKIDRSLITKCCKGKRKTTHGFKFEYA